MARTLTTTAYIEVPGVAAMDGADLSVSLFLKPTALATYEYLSRHNSANSFGGWGMYMDASGALICYTKPISTTGTNFDACNSPAGAIVANRWNHLGMSVSKAVGASFKAYAGGAEVGSITNVYGWDYGSNWPLRIGDSTDGFWSAPPGEIAEVAWWNQRLNADEYKALGAGVSPLAIRPAALVLYMPLRT